MREVDPGGANVPPPTIWQQVSSSVLTFDRTRLEPAAALRCTLGVAVPLAVALALDHAAAAVFLAIGAISVGFGSFQGAYRSRAAVMLMATAAMAVSIFVGSLTAASSVVALAVAGCWSFAAGLLVALGPAGGFVGLQSAIAVLIADAYPADLSGAVLRAAMVVLGGLVQTLFVVSLWPLRRFRHERRLVAQIYRDLAAYARRLAGRRPLDPPPPGLAPNLASVHADPHPFARRGEALVFQALVDEAERLRTSLAAWSLSAADADAARAHEVGAILDEIADAVAEGREPVVVPRWQVLDTVPAWNGGLVLDALLGQVRAAWRTAAIPAHASSPPAPRPARADAMPPTRPTVRGLADALLTLRANLSLRSTACRHGLRLAVAVTTATAVYRFAEVPRGYWLSMTALLVLKPEFRETFVTGGARIAGTLVGGGLGALLVFGLGTHRGLLAALLLLFVWSGYTLVRASYTLFTVCFTGYVVLLLTLSGVAGGLAAEYRILDTIAGGLIALLVYAAWPTWESARARDALAALLEALAADARVMLQMWEAPQRWDAEWLRRSRDAARLARSNAEASVERMLGEPETRRRIDAQLALGILAAARRYALGALALHAGLSRRPDSPRPALAPLREQLAAALESLSHALRTGAPAGDLPPLRRTHRLLAGADAAGIASETDLMVDAVDSMAALLATARPPARRTA